jgi:hypothetical protein
MKSIVYNTGDIVDEGKVGKAPDDNPLYPLHQATFTLDFMRRNGLLGYPLGVGHTFGQASQDLLNRAARENRVAFVFGQKRSSSLPERKVQERVAEYTECHECGKTLNKESDDCIDDGQDPETKEQWFLCEKCWLEATEQGSGDDRFESSRRVRSEALKLVELALKKS